MDYIVCYHPNPDDQVPPVTRDGHNWIAVSGPQLNAQDAPLLLIRKLVNEGQFRAERAPDGTFCATVCRAEGPFHDTGAPVSTITIRMPSHVHVPAAD